MAKEQLSESQLNALRQIIDERLDFVYNVKYRFDRPVEMSNTIYLQNLPVSATGLRIGQLWNNGGVISMKI